MMSRNVVVIWYKLLISVVVAVDFSVHTSAFSALHMSTLPCLCSDLPNVTDTEDTCMPLVLIDTAGCDLNELDVASNESKGNEGELCSSLFMPLSDSFRISSS